MRASNAQARPADGAYAPFDDKALPRRDPDETFPLRVTDRADLETAWMTLTRTTLPALAVERGWPIRADHCFQRVLLDTAVGGCWYEQIAGRPAYRHASDVVLARAVALGNAAIVGEVDLFDLNRRSLGWRGKLRD